MNDLCIRTRHAMLAAPTYLFQGAFQWEKILCITDVLIKREIGWDLLEIKMNSKCKTEHIQDIAFQSFCLQKNNIDIVGKYLLHTNSKYIRHGSIYPHELFISEDISGDVETESIRVPENINAFLSLLENKEYPDQPMGSKFKNPYLCPYIDYCLAEGELKPTCSSDIIINRKAIIEFVSQINTPVYFIDFETYQPAIPVFDGTRPFQYSLHVLDGNLKHFSFLATNRQDPRRLLTESLLSQIGTKGTLVAWNATFEIRCIKQLAEAFPDLRMDLLALIPRFVDLMQPFRKKYYCHPGFKGSYSLKNVLPILVPKLNYKNLLIKKAQDSFMVYHSYVNGGIDDAGWEMAQMGLLAYCGLDTAGMVAILAILKGISR